jgi:hypothetical protein
MTKACIRCLVNFETSRVAAKFCSLHCANQKTKYSSCKRCQMPRSELIRLNRLKSGFVGGICRPCYGQIQQEKRKMCLPGLSPHLRYHVDASYKAMVKRKARARYRKQKDLMLQYGKEWRKSNPERQAYLNKRWRAENKDHLSEYQKKRNEMRRALVIESYGGKCSCCGEMRKEFLTVEHTYKNGAAHREIVKASGLYRWLIKNNFPKDGFTLYCYNCNMYEGRSRICPHKIERGITDTGILELHKTIVPLQVLK